MDRTLARHLKLPKEKDVTLHQNVNERSFSGIFQPLVAIARPAYSLLGVPWDAASGMLTARSR